LIDGLYKVLPAESCRRVQSIRFYRWQAGPQQGAEKCYDRWTGRGSQQWRRQESGL